MQAGRELTEMGQVNCSRTIDWVHTKFAKLAFAITVFARKHWVAAAFILCSLIPHYADYADLPRKIQQQFDRTVRNAKFSSLLCAPDLIVRLVEEDGEEDLRWLRETKVFRMLKKTFPLRWYEVYYKTFLLLPGNKSHQLYFGEY
jgi:hypothetical protein